MGAFGSGFATTKVLGNKEADDLDLGLISKLASVEARDVSGLNEKRLNGEIYGRIGGTLAGECK